MAIPLRRGIFSLHSFSSVLRTNLNPRRAVVGILPSQLNGAMSVPLSAPYFPHQPFCAKRGYCSKDDSQDNDKTKEPTKALPPMWRMPEGPEKDHVRNQFSASARGARQVGNARFWLLNGFYLKSIMFMIDNRFKMNEFVDGARQAFDVVCAAVESGEYDNLHGLVTDDVIGQLEDMSVEERLCILPHDDYDISVCPESCGLMMEDNKRWFEIAITVYFLRRNGEDGFANASQNLQKWTDVASLLLRFASIVRYRFIREYSKGVDGQWQINLIEWLNNPNILSKM